MKIFFDVISCQLSCFMFEMGAPYALVLSIEVTPPAFLFQTPPLSVNIMGCYYCCCQREPVLLLLLIKFQEQIVLYDFLFLCFCIILVSRQTILSIIDTAQSRWASDTALSRCIQSKVLLLASTINMHACNIK